MRHKTYLLAGAAVAVAAGLGWFLTRGGLPSSTANRPWPATVATNEPDRPPILEPSEALKTFHMPPGYQLQLVASEPMIKDPILMEFDGDGRLWIVQLPAWAYNDKIENSLEPVNDIIVLEDTDNDGAFDKRTVFMDKLVLPRAIKVLDKGCLLVGEPPNLWKACDTNGDLKADTKELVADGFGRKGILEHGANGLYWGMDNVLRVSEHTWNVNFKDGKFTTVPTLSRGQWGVTQDDGGRIYRNVNTDPLFVDYVADRYYARNPNLVRTNGLYESLVKQESTQIWPVHPTRGLNRGYRTDVFRDDGTATYYGGVSSPMIYRGTALPNELYGQPLVVDGPTNIVHLLKMTNDGTGRLSAEDFYKKGEFLASTDVRFRPVWLTTGPDGAIYVLDMYRGVSQDGPIQTDYLRDYIVKRGLEKGINRGRLYRVVYKGAPKPLAQKPQMSKETPAQLVEHLKNPSGWWRDTAQQLIVQRGDKSVVPALAELAAHADARTRLQALWTIDGLGAMTESLATKALSDSSPDVRAAALRWSEQFLAGSPAMRAAVISKLEDSNWFVRRQLAATLGELPADAKVAPLTRVLAKYGSDPVTVDLAVSGLAGQERTMLEGMLTQPTVSSDVASALAGAAARTRDPQTVRSLMVLVADNNRTEAVRLGLIKGIAQGLQGPRRGGGGPVAGGRAGGGVPGVARRQEATNLMALPAAPAELLRISRGTGELADAANELLGLLTWPGKPAPPAAPPLTADEQKLFDAGRDYFEANCVGCHGPAGMGVEKAGGKLAGSPIANSQDDSVIRVLISGKEGAIGVMPPLGSQMSDAQVASVLTYVRRSFGNTSAPIVPAAVKESRQAYAHRNTPWTDAELTVRRR